MAEVDLSKLQFVPWKARLLAPSFELAVVDKLETREIDLDEFKELRLRHDWRYPAEYAATTTLLSGELGADQAYRYILRGARVSAEISPVTHVPAPKSPERREHLHDDPGRSQAVVPGGQISRRPGGADQAARDPDRAHRLHPAPALDLVDARLHFLSRVMAYLKRTLPIDILAIVKVEGELAGLETARLYLTTQRDLILK